MRSPHLNALQRVGVVGAVHNFREGTVWTMVPFLQLVFSP
jgi:hypothetical protein